MHLGSLKAELVGVTLADLLAIILQEVEEGLQYPWHLDDVTHAQLEDWLLPLLRHKGVVSLLHLRVVTLAWSTCSIPTTRGTSSCTLSLHLLGVENETFRVVESF